ncbi:uncharacterized protein A1O5_12247 [Cladophialophora psammophila CBS 110553]|uniref:N-acetyltransferase domain-containing protein n=1 Tax=Cladophialophora psammophila CBS 110553 TaxID=1182543 RepID=W9W4C2_9EURO|nr:uncharacterized protein A1O5_12247 [Cladophialophora psammophila CBS 110553]EXJ59366.1 hypothetical protein A1O5_12247 [Cladophialophora psammophila CBS 110553]
MHVRPARASDLADLATIARDAMFDDELTVFLAPHRHEHPECLRQGCLRRVKKRFYDGHLVLAAVSDENDSWWDGEEKVVGYLSATSTKQQKDEEMEKKSWLSFSWNGIFMTSSRPESSSLITGTAFELQLLRLEDLFEWYTHADRSISRQAWLQFQNSVHDRGPLSDINDYWEVDHLSVNPAYHRKGIGSTMVKYMQTVASKDNLPIVLVASKKGRPMYKKLGFVDYGACNMGGGLVAEAMAWYPSTLANSHSAGETEDVHS